MAKRNIQRPDLVPVIVLAGIVALICTGIWLFPFFQRIVQQQDCIAVGRDDCG